MSCIAITSGRYIGIVASVMKINYSQNIRHEYTKRDNNNNAKFLVPGLVKCHRSVITAVPATASASANLSGLRTRIVVIKLISN